MNVTAFTNSARNTFGNDISVLVARAKAFGHADNCVLIKGKRHADCAFAFLRSVKGGKVETQVSPAFMGSRAKKYSVVTFA